MKKLGITLSAIVMVVTLTSFRTKTSETKTLGTANQTVLPVMEEAGIGEVGFTRVAVRTAIAVGRYAIEVTARYTPLLDDAAKACWFEAKLINTKVKDFEIATKKAKMAHLG